MNYKGQPPPALGVAQERVGSQPTIAKDNFELFCYTGFALTVSC